MLGGTVPVKLFSSSHRCCSRESPSKISFAIVPVSWLEVNTRTRKLLASPTSDGNVEVNAAEEKDNASNSFRFPIIEDRVP